VQYLLDTNACVDYLRGRYSSVVERIQRSLPTDLCLSTVVIAELRYGAEKSQKPKKNHKAVDRLIAEIPVMAFDPEAARIYGRVRKNLEAEGKVIGPYDMMIAAHALSLERTLVSDNVKEFERVNGLLLENWRDDGSEPPG